MADESQDKVLSWDGEKVIWTDRSQYNPLTVKEGILPVEHSGMTSALPGQPAYRPPYRTDMFGEQDTSAFSREMQYAAELQRTDPDKAVTLFASPDVQQQIAEDDEKLRRMYMQAESAAEGLDLANRYELFYPGKGQRGAYTGTEDLFVRNEDGSILRRNSVVESSVAKGVKVLSRGAPVYKTIFFRHYENEDETGKKIPEVVPLYNVTLGEAENTARDYVDSIRQTGGVTSGRGTYFKPLKGYTKPGGPTLEGVKNFFTGATYTGEAHTIVEQLYSAPVPVVSSIIKGVTTELADIAGEGTGAQGVQFLMEMEKNFWDFVAGNPNEKEAFNWYRKHSVHDIERLLEKDDATGEFLLGDFLGENLGFTYLALKGTGVIRKGVRSFDDYTQRAIEVERNNIKKRLKKDKNYLAASASEKKQMVQEALQNTNGAVILQTSRVLLQKDIDKASKQSISSMKFLRQAYQRAKYDIGASPNRFKAIIAAEEGAFAYGQYQVGKDDELAGMGLGLLYAFTTPPALNLVNYLATAGSLNLVTKFAGIAELFGGDTTALNTVFDAIAKNMPDGEFTALVQKGIISPAQRKSAIKLYRGISEMPIEFREKAFAEAKATGVINAQLMSWVDEMATTTEAGVKVAVGADNSIFVQQFGPDATVEDIKKQFSFTIGQSFQIDILTLAEDALLEQARIGATLDYNFFAHGKLLERKQEALDSLTKFLDVVDARFEKGANSVALNDFISKLDQQVNTATSEINSNLVHIENIVETQLRKVLNKKADVPYSKADLAEIDNILDTYTNLRVVKFKGENANYTPEDINKIREEGKANKLIVRQRKMVNGLQKVTKTDANLVEANIASASDYSSLVDGWRMMASSRYDEALDGVEGIFLDDALPLLLAVRNNADSTISELYRGADAQNLKRTIDKIYEPVMRKKVDEFYESLVGIKYGDSADEFWKTAEDVEDFFEESLMKFSEKSAFAKYEALVESVEQMDLLRVYPENKNVIPEDFDFLKLELRVDDLDNIMAGLTNEIGAIDNLAAGAKSAKQRKLSETMSFLQDSLDEHMAVLGKSREKLIAYNKARAFYRNSASPILYESEITDWLLDVKRRKKVSKQFPTGFEHVNNIDGKGTNQGFLGYIWDRLKSDPTGTNANLRKIFGVYDPKTDTHLYVTDDMISRASSGPTGQGGGKVYGHTEEELRLIQTAQKTFAFHLQDWFVDKFKRNMLSDPNMPVGFILKTTKNEAGETVYNFNELADTLQEVTSKDGNAIVSNNKFKGLLSNATRDLLGAGVMIDNMVDKELFDSDIAIQLQKKLHNFDRTDKIVVRDLADANIAVHRAKVELGLVEGKYVGKIATAMDHQNILKNTLKGLSGNLGDSTDSMFNYLVLNQGSSMRIDELKDFLVNGTMSARMEGIKNSGKFNFVRLKKLMTEEEFNNAMGKFLAQGLRRASTSEVRISGYSATEWVGPSIPFTDKKFIPMTGRRIGTAEDIQPAHKSIVKRGVDHKKLMNLLDDHKDILEPYINIGAMRVISAVGNILTPQGPTIGRIQSPTTGAAQFTPASWISRFYAANSGRTSYRYIGAEAVVAALLRHEGAVTLALLESKEAQVAIAKMFAEGKVPTQKVTHATYAWLPNLVARVAQIVGEPAIDERALSFEAIHKDLNREENNLNNQMNDLDIVN